MYQYYDIVESKGRQEEYSKFEKAYKKKRLFKKDSTE